MNFETIVIERLKEYPHKRAALTSLREEIEEIKKRRFFPRSSAPGERLGGGDGSTDERYINDIAKLELYTVRLRSALREVKSIDRALEGLDSRQRDVLEAFYMHRIERAAIVLAEKYSCDRSVIYRMKSEALRIVALRLYGVVDA